MEKLMRLFAFGVTMEQAAEEWVQSVRNGSTPEGRLRVAATDAREAKEILLASGFEQTDHYVSSRNYRGAARRHSSSGGVVTLHSKEANENGKIIEVKIGFSRHSNTLEAKEVESRQ